MILGIGSDLCSLDRIATALARHGDRSGVKRILLELSNADKAVRVSVTWLLGQLGDKASEGEADALSALVQNTAERGNIRHLAAAALFNVAADQPAAVSDQQLPPCPWYPDQLCPGECQYLLPRDACIHEPGEAHAQVRRQDPG